MSTSTRSARTSSVALALVLAGVLGVAGCSDEAAPLPSPTTSDATPTEEPTPEPTTASPTDPPSADDAEEGVADFTDETNRIFFSELPELTGEEAAAVNYASAYLHAYWRVLQTNTMSPELSIIAAPGVVAEVQAVADRQVANGGHIGGDATFKHSLIEVTEGSATVQFCLDQTGTTVLLDTGEVLPVVDTGAAPTGLVTLALSSEAGVWTVEAKTDEPATC